jgi:DNA-binding transcriptional ArsR family regulator
MNESRFHYGKTNHHTFLQLKENNVLKELCCLSQDGIHSMLFASSFRFTPQISSLTSFFTHSLGNDGYHNNFSDSRRFNLILWSIIGGTRGGANKARILNLLQDTPMNAHKIAKSLNLDHKTVAYHLKILSKNDLVEKAEKTYGAEYQLSQIMNKNQNVLEEIMEKIGTK